MQDKILKLLELTKSANDAEALNAIRKANDIREKAGLQWEEVFAKSVTTYKPTNLPPIFGMNPRQPKFLTVETMFREILRRDLSDLLIQDRTIEIRLRVDPVPRRRRSQHPHQHLQPQLRLKSSSSALSANVFKPSIML